MYINRGNHEAKEMNRTYGFEGEAKHKHGEQTYKVGVQPSINLYYTDCIPHLAFCACIYNS